MKEGKGNKYRYDDDDSRPLFLNWKHYQEAFQIVTDFADSVRPDSETSPLRDDAGSVPQRPMPVVPEENRRLPVDGYFSFYADLLGFTREVSNGGMDSLPDYYGGIFTAATACPKVNAYLLSDSCFAFAPGEVVDDFIRFVSTVFSRWLTNGLVPRVRLFLVGGPAGP